jgi:hypothetical protein
MKNHFQNYEKLLVDKLFVDKLFVDKLFVDKLFVDKLFVDKMFVDKLFVDKLIVDKLFVDKFERENRDLLLVTKNNFSPSISVLRAEILKETKILLFSFSLFPGERGVQKISCCRNLLIKFAENYPDGVVFYPQYYPNVNL